MDSSHGLRVYIHELVAHFGLAFATTSPIKGLILLVRITRQIIMQKARSHHAYRTLRKDKLGSC